MYLGHLIGITGLDGVQGFQTMCHKNRGVIYGKMDRM